MALLIPILAQLAGAGSCLSVHKVFIDLHWVEEASNKQGR